MSDPLREALERIIAVSDREPRCVNTRDAEEMEAIAREALAIEPKYGYRAGFRLGFAETGYMIGPDGSYLTKAQAERIAGSSGWIDRCIKAGEWERLP